MQLRYRLCPDGSFVAGDLESGFTAYAYPGSENAIRAQDSPEEVALSMLLDEQAYERLLPTVQEYDRRNWRRLSQ